MGQYWIPVNLDKREYISPHKLGCGLKLGEQTGTFPGTGTALLILCAAQRDRRGGGDLDMDENWHGPERDMAIHNVTPGPMPAEYPEIAARTIGRWAGDRIVIVGDYAEDSDLPAEPNFSEIYSRCRGLTDKEKQSELAYLLRIAGEATTQDHADGIMKRIRALEQPEYTDVSDDVCRVIEHELHGKFTDEHGWRDFKFDA